ncbi:hypothetical protein [Priestia megaterium]|uniref:hypothetical protein n=1 Tax=Priestia megaterium TaxID=1404 RepID=UPI000BF896D3|nr:hypothetical protein [Priestia megaterium]PFR93484.1 hypothetical protein COK39_17490 [Priestia megaterium]
MNDVIITIRTETRLFRQPRKIGDVFEHKGNNLLVIGIERFEVFFQRMTVWYTCQNLNEIDYVSKRKSYKQGFELEVEVKLKYDDERFKDRLYIGSVHFIRGQNYKLIEYTDLELDGTDIKASFAAKPIHPLDRKEAKAKLINEKKKKLQLELV